MIATGEGLAVEFCYHRPVREVQSLQEVGDGGATFNRMGLAIEDNLHRGGERSGRDSRRQDFTVPVFPDRIESLTAELSGDYFGRTVVVDLELRGCLDAGATGGMFSGVDFDPLSPDRTMEILCPCPGIAARFGVRAGGDMRDAEGEEAIAESSWFTGGQDDANPGEGKAEGADQLNELAIAEHECGIGLVAVISSMGTEPGEGDGELCLPAAFVKVFEVSGE